MDWGNDGVCDDGGPGSEYAGCTFGYDCDDCWVRLAPADVCEGWPIMREGHA